MFGGRDGSGTVVSGDSSVPNLYGQGRPLDRCVMTHVGGESFDDRRLVRRTVMHQSSQCVDPAKADLDLVVAQLLNGLGVAIGDMALSAEPVGFLTELVSPKPQPICAGGVGQAADRTDR